VLLQLFREKRLNGLKAVDVANTVIEAIDLPRTIQGIYISQEYKKQIHILSLSLTIFI